MKKNITINLYGTLYAIDEDACQLLEQYLDNMRKYFSQRDGGEEIADDIEHRVAELLAELRASGQQAVSINHVQDIIRRIGNPEQMDEEAEAGGESSQQMPPPCHDDASVGGSDSLGAEGKSPEQDGTKRSFFAGRKLYRDPQDQLLGGVMSGLCQYFGGNDPLPWRILMVILALFSFSTIGIIYLVAWAIIPAARTAEERLQMRGAPVNPQTLNDELMRAAHAASNAINSPSVQQKARTLGGTLMSIIVFCAKVLAIFLLGCGIMCIFCVMGVTIAGCFESLHPEGLAYDAIGSLVHYNPLIGWTSMFALLSALVAMCIPFIVLVRSLIKSPAQPSSLSTRTRSTLLLVFVLSLVCSIVATVFTGVEVTKAKGVLYDEYVKTHHDLDDDDDDDMVDYVISDTVADESPVADSVNAARSAAQAAASNDSVPSRVQSHKAIRRAKEQAKSAAKEAKNAAKKAVKDAKKAVEKATQAEVDAAISSAEGASTPSK